MSVKFSTALKNSILASGSIRAAMGGNTGFILDIYTGSRPTSPDDVPNGSLLVSLSNNGGGTGLTFETAAANGALPKTTAQVWKGTVVATGSAGWFRMRLTTENGTAASSTAMRVDGTIGVSGADLNMTNTAMQIGEEYTASTAQLRL